MKQCDKCLGHLPEGGLFCPGCGHTIATSVAESTRAYNPLAAEMTENDLEPLLAIPVQPSSGNSQGPRFPPGTTLLDRYQIISALGKGGMGEVYLAEDLRLSQKIALKFLPRKVFNDPEQFARLHQEVRIARQVSHPMVCRVHDIAEVDGEAFLSMEFIDGENLATLLKRIGRLPDDKGIQISRQLCEGLAAVHEKGIVHRDLKPGNIMIDGQGQVRLTDFGLAIFADTTPPDGFHSGTPAYMSPEQLAGKPPTVQSDIFSLGLVMYEVFTGQRAFVSKSKKELARLYEEHKPTSICDLVPSLDPRIDKAIRQCLEKDPAKRQHTTLEVTASLPKRDPLAILLAEGRTPSPETVANAGAPGSLKPTVAAALLVAIVLGVILIALLASRATISGLIPKIESPTKLTAQAQSILHNLGCNESPLDQRHGYYYDFNYLNYQVAKESSPRRWDRLATEESPALVFWFRQSPYYLVATGMSTRLLPGRVTPMDPTPAFPGDACVFLDPSGRLLEFSYLPDQKLKPSTKKIDFQKLFEEARLDWSTAQEAKMESGPPNFADQRYAWLADRLSNPGEKLRVEAATLQNQVVYFKVFQGEWDKPNSARSTIMPESRLFQYLYASLFCLIVICSAWLARRNYQLGLGDTVGAGRLACFLFLCYLVCMALIADHVPSFQVEATWLMKAVGYAGMWSGLCWLLYYALEPYVRRRWPWRLISWNRLLAGRIHDPMVGRDILIGALLGIFLTLIHQIGVILPPLFGSPSPLPLVAWLSAFTHVPFHLFMELPVAVKDALQFYFLLFLLVLFVRREWLASLLLVSFLLIYNLIQEPELHLFWMALMAATMIAVLFVSLRFGLLALALGLFFLYYLYQLPLSLDFTGWHSWQNFVYLLWPILLAGLGFLNARGGAKSF